MKKLVFLFAMVFAVSMVMAQNTAVFDQSGGDGNTAFSEQIGDGNDLFIKQVIANPTGTNVAGEESDKIIQDGNNNIAKVEQLVTNVDLPRPQSNLSHINQEGNRNIIVGAGVNAQLNEAANAIQIREVQSNESNIDQDGFRNAIGLNQSPRFRNLFGRTSASLVQLGNDNELVVYQDGGFGTSNVSANSEQIGNDNVGKVKQVGPASQTLTLKQYGNRNFVGGALANGDIDVIQPSWALQNSTGVGDLDNVMYFDQDGIENKIGLTQNASGENEAWIYQDGGFNEVGAYQSTTGGYNDLYVSQTGGDNATVLQMGNGNNTA